MLVILARLPLCGGLTIVRFLQNPFLGSIYGFGLVFHVGRNGGRIKSSRGIAKWQEIFVLNAKMLVLIFSCAYYLLLVLYIFLCLRESYHLDNDISYLVCSRDIGDTN